MLLLTNSQHRYFASTIMSIISSTSDEENNQFYKEDDDSFPSSPGKTISLIYCCNDPALTRPIAAGDEEAGYRAFQYKNQLKSCNVQATNLNAADVQSRRRAELERAEWIMLLFGLDVSPTTLNSASYIQELTLPPLVCVARRDRRLHLASCGNTNGYQRNSDQNTL